MVGVSCLGQLDEALDADELDLTAGSASAWTPPEPPGQLPRGGQRGPRGVRSGDSRRIVMWLARSKWADTGIRSPHCSTMCAMTAGWGRSDDHPVGRGASDEQGGQGEGGGGSAVLHRAAEGPIQQTISGGIFFSTVIQGRDVTVQLPPEIKPQLTGLPAANESFVGRDEELRRVLAALHPDSERDEVRAVSVVSGLAGVGKTELVLHAARQALRTEGWFPGGVLFVDLAGYDDERRVTTERALNGFLRALGVPVEYIPDELQDLHRQYASVLAAYAAEGRRVLVVIDNASTTEQVKPLLPTDGVTAVLVTSRHTLAGLDARLHDLDVLEPDAAVDVLRQVLRKSRGLTDSRVDDDQQAARLVADRCGHLPLALQIVAALLADDVERPLSALAQDLADTGDRLDELERDDWAVRAAFTLSHARLSPGQARLFALLSLNAGPDISTEAAARLAGEDDRPARRLLAALVRAHLVARGGGDGRWRMHDLVRLYAYERARDDIQLEEVNHAVVRLWEYYRTTAESAGLALTMPDGASSSGDRKTEPFATRAEAVAWFEQERLNVLGAIGFADTYRNGNAVVALTGVVSGFLHHSRRFEEALAVARLTLRWVAGKPPTDVEAWARELVGSALLEVNRHEEAAEEYQQARALHRERGDRVGEARTVDQLGSAIRQMDGQLESSATAHAEALAICRAIGDLPGEAKATFHLGLTRYEAADYQEAIELHRHAAEIFGAIGDPLGRQTAILCMAAAQQALQDYGATITSYEQSIELYRSAGARSNQATAHEHLGVALQRLGRLREAAGAFREAASLWADLEELAAQAKAIERLGEVMKECGEPSQAATAYRQAATLYREVEDRLKEARMLSMLQWTLSEMERTAEAIPVGLAATKIWASIGDWSSEGPFIDLLGVDLGEAGRWEEAIDVNRRATEVWSLLENDSAEARAQERLGEALLKVGLPADAIDPFRRAADLFQRNGDQAAEARARNMLAFPLHQIQHDREATAELRQAISLFQHLGEHTRAAQAERNLASLQHKP